MFSRRYRLSLGILILAIMLGLVWYGPLLLSLLRPQLVTIQHSIIKRSGEVWAKPNTLSYPRLGIDAALTISPKTSPLNTSDWETIKQSLKKGVSVAFDEADFSSASLVFVTGHSSDTYPHPYSTVFAGLNQASVGDTITLNTNNTNYQFHVVDKQILNPSDAKGFLSFKPSTAGIQRVVLVTCWPPLTTTNRLAVVTERSI